MFWAQCGSENSVADEQGHAGAKQRLATMGSQPEPEPEPAHAARRAAGSRVEVHGLRGAPELNGRVGSVVRWVAAKGRWEVRLDGEGGIKRVKPGNLRDAAAGGEGGAGGAV